MSMGGEESIIDYITCPACGDYIHPPSACCENGHFLCSACRHRVQTCPICSSDKYPNRNNSIFDSILKEIYYPCANHEHGCSGFFRYDQIKDHEKACPFRLVPCVFEPSGCQLLLHQDELLGHEEMCQYGEKCKVALTINGVELLKCGWKGPRSMLQQHVIDEHPSLWISTEISSREPGYWMLPLDMAFRKVEFVIVRDLQEMFYVYTLIDPGRTQTIGVQYIGAHQDAPNFRYAIEFSHEAKRFIFENAVISPSVHPDDVLQSPFCLESRYRFLNRHFSAERVMDFHLSIRRMERNVANIRRSLTYPNNLVK